MANYYCLEILRKVAAPVNIPIDSNAHMTLLHKKTIEPLNIVAFDT